MFLTIDDFWIILVGSLITCCCSLLGCFLVLRKMTMLVDAISHAILPGIVIAFLVIGNRDSWGMLLGAGLVGMGTTFLIEYLHTKFQLQANAAIGIVFTFLFAVGIILVSVFTSQIDLDQDCVLYGDILYIPSQTFSLFEQNIGPKTFWVMLSLLGIIIAFVVKFYRGLFITSFDPTFATAIGMHTGKWHYTLMGLVSLTTIAAFESVGAILVIAFFVVPPATAYLLTQKLQKMLLFSCMIGTISTFLGYLLAAYLDSSVTGAIVVVLGGVFFSTLLIIVLRKKYWTHKQALTLT